jgi:uncharacterized protein YuzE
MAAVSYDAQGDTLYIELGADGPQTEGEEVHPGVSLMFDGAGRIIGIEITSASQRLVPEALDNLPAAAE